MVLPERVSFTVLSQFTGEVQGPNGGSGRGKRLGQSSMARKLGGQSQSTGIRLSASSKYHATLAFSQPVSKSTGTFLLSLSLYLSLSQSDRSDGHWKAKGVHCTRPQAGHPPLDATPAGPRGELAAGTSSPMHPSQCHILCRWSYRSLLPTHPPYWHCPGQRTEHRVFSTLSRTLPGLGFFYRFGEGRGGGHREETLTIKRLDSNFL